MEQSVLSPLFAIQKITEEDPMTRNKMWDKIRNPDNNMNVPTTAKKNRILWL